MRNLDDATPHDAPTPLATRPASRRANRVLDDLGISTVEQLRGLRLADLLGRRNCGHATVLEIVEWAASLRVALSAGPGQVAYPLAVRHAAPPAIDSSGGIRSELTSAVTALLGDRIAGRALARLGLDADDEPTLDEAAARCGSSTASVCRAEQRLRESPRTFALPRLQQALELLARRSPCPAAWGWRAVVEAGLGDAGLSAVAVLRAAEALRMQPPVRAIERAGRWFVADADGERQLDQLAARRDAVCEHDGFGSVRALVAAVLADDPAVAELASAPAATSAEPAPDDGADEPAPRPDTPQPAETPLEASARALVDGWPGRQWVGDDPDLFTNSVRRRGRLAIRVEQVLAVTGRIGLPELRAALLRDQRLPCAPPLGVVEAVCRGLADVELVDGCVIDRRPRAPEDVFPSAFERLLLRVFRERGPVLGFSELAAAVAARGGRPSDLGVHLCRAVFVLRPRRATYALVGAPVAAVSLAPDGARATCAPGGSPRGSQLPDTRHPRGEPGRVVLAATRDPDGCCTLLVHVTPGLRRNGVLGLPAPVADALAGRRFAVRFGAAAAPTTATLRAEAGRVWGFLPLFTRHGGEPGDLLQLRFDPAAGVALARRLDIPEAADDEWTTMPSTAGDDGADDDR